MFDEMLENELNELDEMKEQINLIEESVNTNNNLFDINEKVELMFGNIEKIEKRLNESFENIEKVSNVVKQYEAIKTTINELKEQLKKYDNLPKLIDNKIKELDINYNNKINDINKVNKEHKQEVLKATNEVKELINNDVNTLKEDLTNSKNNIDNINKKVSNVKKYLSIATISILGIAIFSYTILTNKIVESVEVSNNLNNNIKTINDKFTKYDLSNYVSKVELEKKQNSLNEEVETKFNDILKSELSKIQAKEIEKNKEILELKQEVIKRMVVKESKPIEKPIEEVKKNLTSSEIIVGATTREQSVESTQSINPIDKVVINPIKEVIKPNKNILSKDNIFICFMNDVIYCNSFAKEKDKDFYSMNKKIYDVNSNNFVKDL